MPDAIEETAGTIEARMSWWEKNVDEIVIGLVIGAVAVAAIIFLGEKGAVVATSGVTGLSVYLKKDRSTNGN